ncbi:hypothetical protein HNY73_021091 [Argiope bruennichi]|uniref:Uncharacterized protein n=1 Tax=Argiope bruennichi TaxID=94029 RepID=A0A8T0ECU5_ARGBR|nr:hypothetical protein HNY73_021091 [Argiope bruennichi]
MIGIGSPIVKTHGEMIGIGSPIDKTGREMLGITSPIDKTGREMLGITSPIDKTGRQRIGEFIENKLGRPSRGEPPGDMTNVGVRSKAISPQSRSFRGAMLGQWLANNLLLLGAAVVDGMEATSEVSTRKPQYISHSLEQLTQRPSLSASDCFFQLHAHLNDRSNLDIGKCILRTAPN